MGEIHVPQQRSSPGTATPATVPALRPVATWYQHSFPSYSSFHAYAKSHSPSPIPHHQLLHSASPGKTPHRGLPSRGYQSPFAFVLNRGPAPPSDIHLPPIRVATSTFSASPSIGVDDDCDDDADCDGMTRLKTGSNKTNEAPQRRVLSAISPVSSSSHSVGTSAAPEAKIAVKALSDSFSFDLDFMDCTSAINSAESDESEDNMFSNGVPIAPEAIMRVSPELQPPENEVSTQVTKAAANMRVSSNLPPENRESTEVTKAGSKKPTERTKPGVAKPEKRQPPERKREAPRTKKPKNIEHRSAATLPISGQPRPQPSAKVYIIGHRKMAEGDYDFELHLKEGGTYWWDKEVDLFSESPEIVSDYWNSVRGGRERVCDGMWKIWEILNERKVGNRKEFLVGWLGTMDQTWEPETSVRKNALDVLKEWEQLNGTTRKRATPTKTRKSQAKRKKRQST